MNKKTKNRVGRHPPSLREQLKASLAEVDRLKRLTRCKREPSQGTIGGVIQRLREKNGKLLREFSLEAGIAAGLMSRIETNKYANPTLKNLLKIANALKTPLSKILAQWEAELADSSRPT